MTQNPGARRLRPWWGVIERREDLRFSLELGEPTRIAGKCLWEDLERHLAVQLGVGGLVDLAHPALADEGGDVVMAESGADAKRHWGSWGVWTI